MRYGILLCVLALGAAGCHFGRNAESLSAAQTSAGATANVVLDKGTVTGELFAVEDNGLLLLTGQRLLMVPYLSIRQVVFSDIGRAYSVGQAPPSAGTMRALRLISHFPQGIPATAVPKLRSMYATDTVAR